MQVQFQVGVEVTTMDRKKCKRIIKNVSRLLLAQLAEILEEEIGREKGSSDILDFSILLNSCW
jgi:hypothetical protein